MSLDAIVISFIILQLVLLLLAAKVALLGHERVSIFEMGVMGVGLIGMLLACGWSLFL